MALGHSAFAEAPIASAAGVSATVAVTGLPITSALGSLTLSGTANLTLPSQSASTAVGSPTVFVNATATPAGGLRSARLPLHALWESVHPGHHSPDQSRRHYPSLYHPALSALQHGQLRNRISRDRRSDPASLPRTDLLGTGPLL